MVRWVVGAILHSGARCSSVVRASAHVEMGRRIVDSLRYFSFQPVIDLDKRSWYVLSCLWDGAYK